METTHLHVTEGRLIVLATSCLSVVIAHKHGDANMIVIAEKSFANAFEALLTPCGECARETSSHLM